MVCLYCGDEVPEWFLNSKFASKLPSPEDIQNRRKVGPRNK